MTEEDMRPETPALPPPARGKTRGRNGGRPLTGAQPLNKAMTVWMEPDLHAFVQSQGGGKWVRRLLHQMEHDSRRV